MSSSPLSPLAAVVLAGALAAQDAPAPSGFPALGNDPYTAGAFEVLDVVSGPPTRVLAQTLPGSKDGVGFVNLLRWADARAFRGKLIALRLPVQLTAPAVDTTARLWVRILRADGTVAFEDDGLDVASSSTEWTTLTSIGAVAEDATDLCFGLVVQGTVQVRKRDFELEVLEDAAALDPRYAVPQRWVGDPDVRSATLIDAERGLDLRVTSFVPAGHAAGALPHLVLLREDDDLRSSYREGRGFLEAMRLGREPNAVVTVMQPRRGALSETATAAAQDGALLSVLHGAAPGMAQSPTQVFASPTASGNPRVGMALTRGVQAPAAAGDIARALKAQASGDGVLHAERVLLRWLSAQHDAGGEAELAQLLFEASLETLEPWSQTPAVGLASHSLSGHDHSGHDHSGHDHSGHDHSGHDHSGHDHP